jgi:hypothetical protein
MEGERIGSLRRHGGLEGTRYRMREKLLAIGDDLWIETGDRPRAFEVEGGENDVLTFAATGCIDKMALATGAGRLSRMDSR